MCEEEEATELTEEQKRRENQEELASREKDLDDYIDRVKDSYFYQPKFKRAIIDNKIYNKKISLDLQKHRMCSVCYAICTNYKDLKRSVIGLFESEQMAQMQRDELMENWDSGIEDIYKIEKIVIYGYIPQIITW